MDEATKNLLRRTPVILDAMLRGLPEAWVRENEGPHTWSSFDVVGHRQHTAAVGPWRAFLGILERG